MNVKDARLYNVASCIGAFENPALRAKFHRTSNHLHQNWHYKTLTMGGPNHCIFHTNADPRKESASAKEMARNIDFSTSSSYLSMLPSLLSILFRCFHMIHVKHLSKVQKYSKFLVLCCFSNRLYTAVSSPCSVHCFLTWP